MSKLVVTGAAGFIGCNLVRALNKLDRTDLILVDDFNNPAKESNLQGVQFEQQMHRDLFIEWLTENSSEVEFIFHLGARTDTTEFNFRILDSLNLSYTKALWEVCTVKQIPLLYASSAATYGLGENSFSDAHELISKLKPLNPYGLSKQLFDVYALEQQQTPPAWFGLKFFNVYGPHEFHKGRMASVVMHAWKQIKETGKVKLFESHRTDFRNGEQLRDFIYVDDVTDICLYFFRSYKTASAGLNGIYNVGTGHARSFNDLAMAIFNAMGLAPQIEYIPTPIDIRDKYQYYTEAKMDKLKAAGYPKNFTSLTEGIRKYVEFLKK